MSEKTEQPTAQRLREARKKGQLAKSRLFSSAMVTLGGLLGLLAFGDEIAARLKAWTIRLLSDPTSLTPAKAISEAVLLLATMAGPALVGAFLAALAVSVLSAGLQINLGHVTPKLERIDPFKGAKRLLAPAQALELLKGLVVAFVVGWALWASVRDASPLASATLQRDGATALVTILGVLAPAVRRAGLLLALLGLADYAWARRRHLRELMMTREETKREHKSNEGDPHHKARRKQAHAQLASGGPARGVHKASAVVVNPTHIAVALRYDEGECEAPYIVAKGREEDALNIRKAAKALGIPIVRDVPLARSLVHYDVGEEVPEELYKAAAAVLKVALEKSERPEGETP